MAILKKTAKAAIIFTTVDTLVRGAAIDLKYDMIDYLEKDNANGESQKNRSMYVSKSLFRLAPILIGTTCLALVDKFMK